MRKASACPGLFRLVPARDGALCRIKLPFGQITASQARALSDAAARFGNGIIEVTNRANIQVRGVREAADDDLVALLLDAGLGPRHPETDDIRNVMVSPTAGIDPAEELDAVALARTLLDVLETDTRCHALSPKFSLLVDGGEQTAMVEHPHDIWLASAGDGLVALGFAGCPPVAVDDTDPFLVVPASRGPAAMVAAALLFLDEAKRYPDVTRLKHLFAFVSKAAWAERVARILDGVAVRRDWRRRRPQAGSHVGAHPQRQAGRCFVGMVPPVGRLSPQTLNGLAGIAERFAGGQIRLTPWQSVLLPGIAVERAPEVEAAAVALGMACSTDHPLAHIVACAGAAGCARGNADTKSDARLLRHQPRGAVHLTGCARSCALPWTAETTLVAVAPGTYDLFRKAAGAGDKFGRLVGRNLTIAQVNARLAGSDVG